MTSQDHSNTYFNQLLSKIKSSAGNYSLEKYSIGGAIISCAFYSNFLRNNFNLALQNLHTTEEHNSFPERNLEIVIADSASCGCFAPPPMIKCRIINGLLSEISNERFQFYYFDYLDLFFAIDFTTNRAIYWIDREINFTVNEFAAPFRHLFHTWFTKLGMQLLHAGAVGKNGRGVLLIGKGGSGKSTTSLLCLQAGMEYVGDDYVLTSTINQPKVWSIGHTAKLTQFSQSLMPDLLKHCSKYVRCDEKKLVFLGSHWGKQLKSDLNIAAIILPKPSSEKAALTPLTSAQAMIALAPSTMGQLHNSGPQNLSQIAALVKILPAYEFKLGSDIAAVPQKLEELLSKVK